MTTTTILISLLAIAVLGFLLMRRMLIAVAGQRAEIAALSERLHEENMKNEGQTRQVQHLVKAMQDMQRARQMAELTSQQGSKPAAPSGNPVDGGYDMMGGLAYEPYRYAATPPAPSSEPAPAPTYQGGGGTFDGGGASSDYSSSSCSGSSSSDSSSSSCSDSGSSSFSSD